MENPIQWPDFSDKTEKQAFLSGPAGQIEMLLAAPGASATGNETRTCIVCHPHSLMGGTMNNKVVHTISRLMRDQGCYTVRFNFRGVGASDGVYDAGVGESEDLLAVIQWVYRSRPNDAIVLAGFSFGSWVCARTVDRAVDVGFPIECLILIAPAVENYGFDELHHFSVPLIALWGDQDEVVAPEAISSWFAQVTSYRQNAVLSGAGHFFHGQLVSLKETLKQLIDRLPKTKRCPE
jgi:alpha/beta superfamily hydrolase